MLPYDGFSLTVILRLGEAAHYVDHYGDLCFEGARLQPCHKLLSLPWL